VRLSDFILDNRNAILLEWERFVKTLRAGGRVDEAAQRAHAEQILMTIAAEMRVPQTGEEQEAKSKSQGGRRLGARSSAAQSHAGSRLAAGFKLNELMAEYRALRASVVRLWMNSIAGAEPGTLDELARFNDALDEALAEAIAHFSEALDRSRELFMGVLGHDLRTPLHVILQSAESLSRRSRRSPAELTGYVLQSARHMQRMIDDLLDVSRTRLGGSLPLEPASVDLTAVCNQTLRELRALHPGSSLLTTLGGDLCGVWDPARLEQLLTNLVRNAIQHGDATKPVTISARGENERIILKVHNHGDPIPAATRVRIFEPLVRGVGPKGAGKQGRNMGLGLYIAFTIAEAHGGSIEVESSRKSGTCFTVSLPRHAAGGRRSGPAAGHTPLHGAR
jgi:signal transduction histidine kinase